MTSKWIIPIIIIVAVVVIAAFSLKSFNPSTTATTTSYQTTSIPSTSTINTAANTNTSNTTLSGCQVVRPNGPGTSPASLIGTCTNQTPQSVARFDSAAVYNGSGSSSGINASNHVLLNGTQATVVGWLYASTPLNSSAYINNFVNLNNYSFGVNGCFNVFSTVNPHIYNYYFMNGNFTGEYAYGSSCNTNKWVQYVGIYNNGVMDLYVNGVLVGSNSTTNSTTVGVWEQPYPYLNIGWPVQADELAANIQIYNTSLSQSEISSLYIEGIGGEPIELQHLVGWWPLNGNANDYSGNNNNGTAYNVTFTSNWENGYTSP